MVTGLKNGQPVAARQKENVQQHKPAKREVCVCVCVSGEGGWGGRNQNAKLGVKY